MASFDELRDFGFYTSSGEISSFYFDNEDLIEEVDNTIENEMEDFGTNFIENKILLRSEYEKFIFQLFEHILCEKEILQKQNVVLNQYRHIILSVVNKIKNPKKSSEVLLNEYEKLLHCSISSKKMFVYNFLTKMNTREVINKYVKKEGINIIYALLAEKDSCIIELTGIFLKKYNLPFSNIIIDEITERYEDWTSNQFCETPYKRTSYFRAFLYNIYDINFGYGAHSKLDSVLMKNILSTSRLHFSLYDLYHYDFDKLKAIIVNNNQEFKEEYNLYKSSYEYMRYKARRNLNYNSTSKKFIPVWKLKHLKNIFIINNTLKRQLQNLSEYHPFYEISLLLFMIDEIKLGVELNQSSYNGIAFETINDMPF